MRNDLKTLLGVLAVFSLWSCSNKPAGNAGKDGIETDGNGQKLQLAVHLKNAQADEYLYLYEFDGTQQMLIDSFITDNDGNFAKEYAVSYPAFYTISLYDKQSAISFIMNEGPVTITADANDAENAQIEGGADNAVNKKFQALNAELMGESQQLRMQGQMAQTAEEQATFRETYEAFVARAKTNLASFVEENKNSIVTIQAMNMLSPDEDYESMKKVANHLFSQYPTAPVVKNYHKQITDLGLIAIGNEAPDFALKTAEGAEIKLSSLRGQYVMIDFWASWCGPCRKENPHVKEVYADFHKKGFQILGVSVDQDKQAWQQAVSKDGLPWLHVIDEAKEVGRTYNVTGIPFTVLLDKEGKIIAKGLRSEALREKLKTLL